MLFSSPHIDESLDALLGAQWFSTQDLVSGYNQVPVLEQDRPKTAFCTPCGLFEWNHMPFGLHVRYLPTSDAEYFWGPAVPVTTSLSG